MNSSAMASILGEDEEAKLAAQVAEAEAKKQQAIADKKMQEFVAKVEGIAYHLFITPTSLLSIMGLLCHVLI
jgi:glycyl-tRNA synthetase beta subunit